MGSVARCLRRIKTTNTGSSDDVGMALPPWMQQQQQQQQQPSSYSAALTASQVYNVCSRSRTSLI
jgi:hypothetical protein